MSLTRVGDDVAQEIMRVTETLHLFYPASTPDYAEMTKRRCKAFRYVDLDTSMNVCIDGWRRRDLR